MSPPLSPSPRAAQTPLIVPRRRFVLLAACAAVSPAPMSSAMATPAEVAALIQALAGDAPVRDGLVHLDLPVLIENGNAVAMTVSVADPPSPVRSIHVFAEANPLPEVAAFHFGPRSGAPRVSTRIRLATSQTVTAIARLRDGSCWRDSIEVLVTLAACLE